MFFLETQKKVLIRDSKKVLTRDLEKGSQSRFKSRFSLEIRNKFLTLDSKISFSSRFKKVLTRDSKKRSDT